MLLLYILPFLLSAIPAQVTTTKVDKLDGVASLVADPPHANSNIDTETHPLSGIGEHLVNPIFMVMKTYKGEVDYLK